jgi:hypothetical protein
MHQQQVVAAVVATFGTVLLGVTCLLIAATVLK